MEFFKQHIKPGVVYRRSDRDTEFDDTDKLFLIWINSQLKRLKT
jgi:hypothetical protein